MTNFKHTAADTHNSDDQTPPGTNSDASRLRRLIAAHAAASEEMYAAELHLDEVQTAVDRKVEKDRVLVPIMLLSDGTGCSEWFEVNNFSDEEIIKRIREAHAQLRHTHCSSWAKGNLAHHIADIEAAIDASEAGAIAGIAHARGQVDELEASLGLPAAYERNQAAEEAEQIAKLEVLSYRPMSQEELSEKLAYVEILAAGDWMLAGRNDLLIAALKRLSSVSEFEATPPVMRSQDPDLDTVQDLILRHRIAVKAVTDLPGSTPDELSGPLACTAGDISEELAKYPARTLEAIQAKAAYFLSLDQNGGLPDEEKEWFLHSLAR